MSTLLSLKWLRLIFLYIIELMEDLLKVLPHSWPNCETKVNFHLNRKNGTYEQKGKKYYTRKML